MRLILIIGVSLLYKTATFAKDANGNTAPASSPSSNKTDHKSTFFDAKNKAEELLKKANPDEAIKLLTPHLPQFDKKGFSLLIKAYEEKKNWPEVIRLGLLSVAKYPQDAITLTSIGRAHFMRGKSTEAKESLKKAIETDKNYLPAYEAMAKIYEKNPYELRILYQDMLENFGPKPEFLAQLCAISANDGDNEQGEITCKQAIAAQPNNADNHVYLGLIAKQKGETDRARTTLKNAADKFSKSEFAQFQIASFFESEKNSVDAFTYFDRCLTLDEKSERCLLGLALAAVQVQKNEIALSSLRKLCQLSGRKHSLSIRKAISVVRQRQEFDWTEKFERIAERCSNL